MCPIPPVHEHIALYISQYYSDIELYEKYRHLLSNLWFDKWLSYFNYMNERALLSHESGIYGGQVEPSIVQHPGFELVCFAIRCIGKHETVRLYYDTLLYYNMELEPDGKWYGEGMMKFTPGQFRMWEVILQKKGVLMIIVVIAFG